MGAKSSLVLGCFWAAVAVGSFGGATAAAEPPACTSRDIVQCAWAGPSSPAESNVVNEYAFADLTDARVPLGSVLTAVRGSCGMLAGGAKTGDVIVQISLLTGLINEWSGRLLHDAAQADCPKLA
jgi:hypothetical protein